MVLPLPIAIWLQAEWHKLSPADVDVYSVSQEKKDKKKIDIKD